MATQQRLRRLLAQVPLTLNSQIPIQMPRNYDYETIFIRISGTVTLPVALAVGSNGFKPALRSDAPSGLITNVQLLMEGRNALINVPFHVLNQANVRRSRNFFSMAIPETYGATQNPGLVKNAATASTALVENTAITFEATIAVDLQNVLGMRPKDSVLRSGGMQTLDLRITTADSAALFYQASATLLTTPFAPPAIGATLAATTAATNPITNAFITVTDIEMQEMGDANGAVSVPGYSQRYSYQEFPIVAANGNLEVNLPTDNFIGSVILSSKIGGESVDGVITNCIIKRGLDQRINMPIRDLIAQNERDYKHPRIPGYYILDVMGSGAAYDKLSDAWNVQGGADTRLALGVQSPGSNVLVGMTVIEYIPVAPRK